MKQKPSRQELGALVKAIQNHREFLAAGRTGFVVTAIYCQINEGIRPAITATLRYQDFNFEESWVEFLPFNRFHMVRRPLSAETRQHLMAQMEKLGADRGGLIQSYVPARHSRGQAKPRWNDIFSDQINAVRFDSNKFNHHTLQWVWLDENPQVRAEEVRTDILASFILRWSKTEQQEALFRLLYKNTPVLRPSWAHPEYADASDSALSGKNREQEIKGVAQ